MNFDWLKKILEAIWAFLTQGNAASKPKEGWEGLIQAIKDSDMHPSQKLVCMAQAILESARGTSELAISANNFFGMKHRPELEGIAFGTYTYTDKKGDRDPYSAFATPVKSVEGYRAFINRSPYKGWQNHLSTPEAYIRFIFACGYTVPPEKGEKPYDDKIIALFPEASALLEGEPERPTHTDDDVPVQIVTVKGVKAKNIGRYKTPTGQARGCVVHFTAGRFGQGKENAINTLKDMVSRGLSCLVMDINGIIYAPENYSLSYYNYHAGTSSWRGVTSVSAHLEGMEICNAGRLDGSGKAWFGQQIPQDQIRNVKAEANRVAGNYHAYTEAQEKALIAFLKKRLKEVPGYSVDWIAGHDEVSPGRKNDPGGSLSVTMPELRAKL